VEKDEEEEGGGSGLPYAHALNCVSGAHLSLHCHSSEMHVKRDVYSKKLASERDLYHVPPYDTFVSVEIPKVSSLLNITMDDWRTDVLIRSMGWLRLVGSFKWARGSKAQRAEAAARHQGRSTFWGFIDPNAQYRGLIEQSAQTPVFWRKSDKPPDGGPQIIPPHQLDLPW